MADSIIRITKSINGNIDLAIGRENNKIILDGKVVKKMKKTQYTLQESEAIYNNYLEDKKDTIVSKTFHFGLGYVSNTINQKHSETIFNILKKTSIQNLFSNKKYHFTLYYDRSNSAFNLKELDRNIKLKAEPISFEILAPNSSAPALAIIFKSDDLQQRFKELSDDFVSDFDSYLPHITIKYHPTQSDYDQLKLVFDEIKRKVPFVLTEIELWKKTK